MHEHEKSPRCSRYTAVIQWPNALATPYGLRGRNGVDSDCGVSAALPKTSLLEAWTKRMPGSTRWIASSSRTTAKAFSSPVEIGSVHNSLLEARAARL